MADIKIENPLFLGKSVKDNTRQLLSQFFMFVLIIVYVLICFSIGLLFSLLDKSIGTKLVAKMNAFFEIFT